MSDEQKAAIERAHKALFALDGLLAETYSPTREILESLHHHIYAARIDLETYFGCKP